MRSPPFGAAVVFVLLLVKNGFDLPGLRSAKAFVTASTKAAAIFLANNERSTFA